MKRAVGEAQKNQRKDQILAQVAQLLATRDFETLTLTEVAQGLGLVKGTLYRYFPTKEALVMEVLTWEIELWLAAMAEALTPATQSVLDTAGIARELARILAGKTLMVRLFSIVHVVLEKNVSLERLISFKTATAKVLFAAGEMVEKACPALIGRGPQVILALYELSIGIGHLCDRSPLVVTALQTPGLEVFRLDFETHLSQALTWTLDGMIRENLA